MGTGALRAGSMVLGAAIRTRSETPDSLLKTVSVWRAAAYKADGNELLPARSDLTLRLGCLLATMEEFAAILVGLPPGSCLDLDPAASGGGP
jgi:hypothetical protein